MPKSRSKLPTKGPGSRKFGIVMREFAEGQLHSRSGDIVTNPRQARAIAASEARRLAKGK